jgi:hypothetical protein
VAEVMAKTTNKRLSPNAKNTGFMATFLFVM